jgi:hypothetical protein
MKTFDQKRSGISEKATARKTKELEETLQTKDTIIAQLAQKLLELKKVFWSELCRCKIKLQKRQRIESEVTWVYLRGKNIHLS